MRRRLVLSITAAATAVLLAVGIPLVLVVRRLAEEEARTVLRRQAEVIAANLADELATGRPITVQTIADATPPDDQLIVVAADGRRVESGDPISGPTLSASVDAVAGTRLLLVTSAESVHDRFRQALVLFGLIAAGGVVAAAGLARWQADRLTRPLNDLARSAERLGGGDFSTAAPRSGLSEVDTIAAALDASATRIGELVRAEREFSANASHQLRTALTGLRLRLEELVATSRGEAAAEAEAALEQADRFSVLLDELLRLARTGRSGDAVDVDLCALARGRWVDFETRIGAVGRTISVQAPPEPVVARASPGAIGQALDVLVDNAVVHGAGAVTVWVQETPGWGFLTVAQETGAVDEPGALFTRRPTSDGHGIGLALARTLVEADGGRLDLARADPAAFRIALPLVPATGADSPS